MYHDAGFGLDEHYIISSGNASDKGMDQIVNNEVRDEFRAVIVDGEFEIKQDYHQYRVLNVPMMMQFEKSY